MCMCARSTLFSSLRAIGLISVNITYHHLMLFFKRSDLETLSAHFSNLGTFYDARFIKIQEIEMISVNSWIFTKYPSIYSICDLSTIASAPEDTSVFSASEIREIAAYQSARAFFEFNRRPYTPYPMVITLTDQPSACHEWI